MENEEITTDVIEEEGEVTEGEEEVVEEQPEETEEETPDVKDKNRKGFEIRQQEKAKKESVITSLSKRLEETEAKLKELSEVSTDSDWRKSHPEVSDDLFNLIKLSAKGSGKSYDDSLNNPIIKAVIDTSASKSRISSSTPAPSTKTTSPSGKSVWDMSAEEFKAHQEDVMRKS